MFPLSILFGGLVGFALGLTGGGGSLLAVPLLVYGLAVAPREAFGVSLAAVGATALVGVIPRIRAGQVEVGTGVLFALAGMLGAPLGTWVAGMIPETMLLSLFSILMLIVAWRLWSKSSVPETVVPVDCNVSTNTHSKKNTSNTNNETTDENKATGHCASTVAALARVRGNSLSPAFWRTRLPDVHIDRSPKTCQRTADGRLRLTSRCAMLLVLVGLVTGFLSGMFGVGGGFVIVPALVLFSSMPIHKAVATSLLVIVLVSISGVASHIAAGRHVSLELTGLFVLGGVIGMSLGGLVSQRLPAVVLQKVFALGIVAVAVFVVGKTLA